MQHGGSPAIDSMPAATELNASSSVLERTSDTLIFVPTYNEAETINPLLDRLLNLEGKHDVLIVDDGSKDGTLDSLVARRRSSDSLRVIVRQGKLGIGSAHKLAWLYARKHGYARLVSLDADLSHDPADIPRLLAALDAGADVSIGSRYAPGGRTDYRGWRLLLSWTANKLARLLLRLPLSEYTTSLRAAKLDRVPPYLVESIETHGYGFFLICATRLARQGLVVTEIPTHFHDRHGGKSKIPRTELIRGVTNLLKLTINRRPAKLRALPNISCDSCGQSYGVISASGEETCLFCLSTRDGQKAALNSNRATVASGEVAEHP